MLTYQITRDLSHDCYRQILDIRKEHYPGNLHSPEYWLGGIVGLLSEDIIERSHNSDPTSYFLLIYNRDTIVAYSRYSINYLEYKGNHFSKLHIFICKKEMLSQQFELEDNGKISIVKLGKFMLQKVLDHCALFKSTILVSEICVFPYPNLPSLTLHRNNNFISILNKLKSISIDNVDTQFIILLKPLNNQSIFPNCIPDEL